MIRLRQLRKVMGSIALDWPRFLACMASPDGWVRMRNRADRVTIHPAGGGVRCDWEFTRRLHICDVFPGTGRWLLRRALRTNPIRLRTAPETVIDNGVCWNGRRTDPPRETVDVSFVIGHRGLDRLRHLLATLQSVAAQQNVRFECLVVEQEVTPTIRECLPRWVRYLHTPAPVGLPFCRSWAFNVGAAQARAPLLIFHDNDMLVPEGYAALACALFREGVEAMNLKRFIFYLGEHGAPPEQMLSGSGDLRIDEVIENLEGGGSVAIGAQAFDAIGGFDEAFVGWGGEDMEFWDRCRTLNVWTYTRLPLIHLWHAAQSGKRAVRGLGALTADLTERRRALAPEVRIAELHRRVRGRQTGGPNLNRLSIDPPPARKE